MKKSTLLTLLFAHCALASASASNIAFISFHSGDNTPTANAAAAGFTQAPDVGYTNLLAANGHTVTRIVGSTTPDAALLNSFDLIVVGRSNGSGNFQTAASAAAWNNLSAPMIVMGGYLTRNSRLGFTSGATVPDTFNQADAVVDTISLTALVPAHPVFAGVSLDGSNTTSPFATEITFSGGTTPVVQRGISVNTDPLVGGTLLAKVANAGDPANTGTGMIIAEWAAGSVLGNTPASTLAGNRMVFLSGSREMGITSEGAGIYDLTADGSRMFLNAVGYMAVPEPSSTMTLGLLGAAALLRRRRK